MLRFLAALALAGMLTAAPSQAQLTPTEAAAQLGRGLNLGNTLEPPTEGAWNNGPAQEHYFDDYVAAGFSTVRIPVRWDQHMGQAAPFTIDAAWLDRVEQVVDWALDRDLYVILNAHHDDWLKQDYDNPTLQARFDSLWSQVATRFQDKPDRLLFEMFNEPFDPMTLADTDDLNARVLPLIRRTNPTRIVLYSGASYSSRTQLIAAQVPDDPYVMGYYHSYDPYEFGLLGQGTWGSAQDRSQLRSSFDQIAAWSASAGVPVVLSEFGAIRTTDYNSRMRFYGAFVAEALRVGIPFQAWDDGGDFEIYQRRSRDWNDLKDILIGTSATGPNAFAATVRDDTLAALTWDLPGGQNTSVTVQRRVEGGAFASIAELAPGETAYTDTLRSDPETYTYRVIARSAAGADAYSYPQQVTLRPTRRAPWGGTPVALPGTVEAENYDVGGEGLTYHDTDSDNVTGAYRPDEGVDIEARTDGGFHIAYVEAGEWTEYTVTVPEADQYRITAYVASRDGGGTFSFRTATTQTRTFAVPQTGDWETLAAVSQTIRLGAGEQTIRFQISNGSTMPFNLDRFEITRMNTALEGGVPSVALQVAPNPAHQRVVVSGVAPQAGRQMEVYDALGKRVLTVALTQEAQSVPLDGLAGGVYVLRVVEDGATLAQRPFVVVR